MMIEVDAEFNTEGKGLKHEVKRSFNLMRKSGKDFHVRIKDAAKPGYKIHEVDSFCEDSDWLK